MGDLSPNFSEDEFVCHCGCGKVKISQDLLWKLQAMRDKVGPIEITSGYRCPEHNEEVSQIEKSAHTTGEAADLEIGGSEQRFSFIQAALEVEFTRIGVAETFIHVDVDMSKPQKVIWCYG